jgi:predicted NAD/FAD-binding protein
VLGGSRSYVARLADGLDVRLNADIAAILRGPEGIRIVHRHGLQEPFTDVVIATHADQALGLLGDADGAERTLLGAFRYTENTAVVHTDAGLMPRQRGTWASWNYIGGTEPGADTQLCVTYWMNRLQQLNTRTQIFLTLNPIRPIAAEQTHRVIGYAHPHFDHAALAAQRRLASIQGRRNTWFAGSYFGHGFHEDALKAGLAAAEGLGGVTRPWAAPGKLERPMEHAS